MTLIESTENQWQEIEVSITETTKENNLPPICWVFIVTT